MMNEENDYKLPPVPKEDGTMGGLRYWGIYALQEHARAAVAINVGQPAQQPEAVVGQKPIGYAPTYLTERIAAGDAAVMLTVTRKPLPGHGVTVALYTGPVPAAGMQGDLVIGFPDPEAVFAMFCDREGFPSDGETDAALRKAFYEGTKLGHPAPSILPDSGRDAALTKFFDALRQIDFYQFNANREPCWNIHEDGHFCGRAKSWAGHECGYKYVSMTDAITAALAARPAPSSDVARAIAIAGLKGSRFKADGSEEFTHESAVKMYAALSQIAGPNATMICNGPANGAQAGHQGEAT